MRHATLVLLAEEPMHGYQIMQEMQERSDGGWEPSPGSVYPTLQQLADEGLVVSEPSDGKNVFSLTEAGRHAVAELDDPPPWERFQGGGAGGAGRMRRSVMQLGAAARQVGMAGTDAQVDQAIEILDDARKKLYGILAADDA
ncbi:MAG: PadR family transcriptional regulator [Actinomycetota bacterium]